MRYRIRKCIGLITMLFLIGSGVVRFPTADAATMLSPSLETLIRSTKPIPILVEFKGFDYHERQNRNGSTQASNRLLVFQQRKREIQRRFLSDITNFGFQVGSVSSLQCLMNVIQVTVPGYALPFIAHHPSVRKIYPAQLSWKPSRTLVRKAWFNEASIPPDSSCPYTGKGVLVGVIDTGLDIGEEFRGRDIQGKNFANPDEGWFDTNYHGTAVAGIIGGNGPVWYQKGVAPDVSLRVYKVFTKEDYRPLGVLQAIEQAVIDQCDILNLSLNGMDSPEFLEGNELIQQAITEAKKSGILVVVSSGNLSNITAPGTFRDTLTVGSADDRSFMMMQLKSNELTYTVKAYMGYMSMPFTKDLNQLPFVYAGYGSVNDFDGQDVKDKIVLIDRGPIKDPITFYEKVSRATEQGAKAVILVSNGNPFHPNINLEYRNYPSYDTFLIENPYDAVSERQRFKSFIELVPTAMISQEDGRWIKNHLSELQVGFLEEDAYSFGQYLSKGIADSHQVKPDLLAPAEMILAPYQKQSIEQDPIYVAMFGSSTAAAFVTGAVALLKEAHPQWNHQQMITVLQNSASLLRNPYSQLPFDMLFQGAGVVQPDKAIFTKIMIEPAVSVYKPVAGETCQWTVSNLTDQALSLPVSVESSCGENEWIDLIRNQLPVSVTLNPHEKKQLNLTLPETLDIETDIWIQLGEAHCGIRLLKNKTKEPIRPITDFSVSETKITSPLQSPLLFHFTLHEGSLLGNAVSTQHLSEGVISLRLLNQYKHVITEISVQRRAWLGKNEILWDGILSETPLHISKGTYYFELTLYRFQITPQQTTQTIISDQALVEVHVTRSEGTSRCLCIATDKKTAFEDTFPVTLNFTEPMQLRQLELELSFTTPLLAFQKAVLLPPWANDSSILYEITGSNAKGFLKVSVVAKAGKSFSIPAFTPFLRINMLPDQIGMGQFIISHLQLTDFDNRSVPIVAIPSQTEITDQPFLLTDFNFDNQVDLADKDHLWSVFGMSIGQPGYDYNTDINQNGRIGPEEVIRMGKEWEQNLLP